MSVFGNGSAVLARVEPEVSAAVSLRVLVADDEGLFRAGLVRLVDAEGHKVVGQARDGFEALEQARHLRPDVILMDIGMPRCNGLEATRLIKAELPEIKIVLVTAAEEGGELLEAIRSGVEGYVLKDMTEEELGRALAGIEGGAAPLSACLGPPAAQASGPTSVSKRKEES